MVAAKDLLNGLERGDDVVRRETYGTPAKPLLFDFGPGEAHLKPST